MDNAAEILLKKLPSEILSECKLQLQQFKRIIYADRIAVKSLKDRELDSNLKTLRRDINKYEREARISEKSAVKFIDEVIDLLEN